MGEWASSNPQLLKMLKQDLTEFWREASAHAGGVHHFAAVVVPIRIEPTPSPLGCNRRS
jgi:hypothetical protein